MIETKSKTYPVFIGDVLIELKNFINSLKKQPTTILVITDETVGELYLQVIKELLTTYKVVAHIIPSGEENKSFEKYYECHTVALENNLDRDSIIIALGGGVIGDLAGFVAATYMRGIRFIQMPTTLLAHDSAVGGKVAVNHPLGKNMIGAFYQPEAVIYHLPFLSTLPYRELRSGFGEVIKHGYLSSSTFLNWIDENIVTLNDLDITLLSNIVTEGIKVKANIVAQDEMEKGVRAYLNFGHTLAHAIESEMGYGAITHGDAVAIGMKFAMIISEEVLEVKVNKENLNTLFERFQYPNMPKLNLESLIEKMKQDKKSYGGKINMVLMRDIGKMEVVEVPEDIVREQLEKFMK